MRATRRAVAVRLALFLAVLAAGFLVLQRPVRHIEALIAAGLTERITGSAAWVIDSVIIVSPGDRPFFVALLTPACSALAATASICLLGLLAPRVTRGRRIFAVSTAVAVVVVGNFIRLTGSLVAGAWAGKASLIFFHDTLGSFLTFVYILGGYVVMLWLLLPAERTPLVDELPREERDHVLA